MKVIRRSEPYLASHIAIQWVLVLCTLTPSSTPVIYLLQTPLFTPDLYDVGGSFILTILQDHTTEVLFCTRTVLSFHMVPW